MTENFPKLMSDAKPQILEAQSRPSRINTKKNQNQNKNKNLQLGMLFSNCKKSKVKSWKMPEE